MKAIASADAAPLRPPPARSRLLGFYARLARIDDWFERRFTPIGRLTLWSMLVAGLFGVDTRRSLAYQMFALLAALMVVALLAARIRRVRGTRVERRLPGFATVGTPFEYRVAVHVPDGDSGTLWLRDRLAAPLPTPAAFAALSEPESVRRGWVDRKLGFARWMWLKRRAQGARTSAQPSPELSPDGTVRLRLTPLRRGYLQFAAVEVGRNEPLGLVRDVESCAAPGRLLVLPRRFPVSRALLPGAGQQREPGGGLTDQPGHSDEFLGVREYRPGDAVRHIHWKRFARLGEPVVREFQREASRRHAVILDSAGALSGETTFETAVSIAASVVERAYRDDGAVDLVLGGTSFAARGHRALELDTLLAALACVDGMAADGLDTLADEVLMHRHLVHGAVCVLLDWDAPRRRLVGRLADAGLRLAVVVVRPRRDDDAGADASVAGLRFVAPASAEQELAP